MYQYLFKVAKSNVLSLAVYSVYCAIQIREKEQFGSVSFRRIFLPLPWFVYQSISDSHDNGEKYIFVHNIKFHFLHNELLNEVIKLQV